MSWAWWRNKKRTAAVTAAGEVVAQSNQKCADENRLAWLCWKCKNTFYGVWPYEAEVQAHSAQGLADMRQWLPLCVHCVEGFPHDATEGIPI
jgi:hypothetical protein